jgi:hypothetical protein
MKEKWSSFCETSVRLFLDISFFQWQVVLTRKKIQAAMVRGVVVDTEQIEEPEDEDTLQAYVKRTSELKKFIQEEIEKEYAEEQARRRKKEEEKRVSSSAGWFNCRTTKGRI